MNRAAFCFYGHSLRKKNDEIARHIFPLAVWACKIFQSTHLKQLCRRAPVFTGSSFQLSNHVTYLLAYATRPFWSLIVLDEPRKQNIYSKTPYFWSTLHSFNRWQRCMAAAECCTYNGCDRHMDVQVVELLKAQQASLFSVNILKGNTSRTKRHISFAFSASLVFSVELFCTPFM